MTVSDGDKELRNLIFAVVIFWTGISVSAAEPNPAMIEGLRPVAGFVGTWNGKGTREGARDWREQIAAGWGFREQDGRAALELFIDPEEDEEQPPLEAILVTFDPEQKSYGLVTRDTKKNVRHFRGELVGESSLRLDRADSDAKDHFDRVEIRLLQGGEKLLYQFSKKVGRNFFQMHTQVEAKREGPVPEAELAQCVVTGAPSQLEVDIDGKTYFVACQACADELRAHPERYIKPAEQEAR